MKRRLFWAAVCLLGMGTAAHAARDIGGSFGTLATAEGVGRGEYSVTGSIGIADATTAFGVARYGLTDRIDARMKMGVRDEDGTDAEFIVGGDVKFQLLTVEGDREAPLDVSVGALSELWTSDLGNLWQVGGFVIGSYPAELENGMRVEPYGRFNARVERIAAEGRKYDSSELELGITAGGMLGVTENFNVYGEYQLEGSRGVFFGIEVLGL